MSERSEEIKKAQFLLVVLSTRLEQNRVAIRREEENQAELAKIYGSELAGEGDRLSRLREDKKEIAGKIEAVNLLFLELHTAELFDRPENYSSIPVPKNAAGVVEKMQKAVDGAESSLRHAQRRRDLAVLAQKLLKEPAGDQ